MQLIGKEVFKTPFCHIIHPDTFVQVWLSFRSLDFKFILLNLIEYLQATVILHFSSELCFEKIHIFLINNTHYLQEELL